jgi:alpha-glucoside transport system substrate-binding protein
MSTRSVRLIMAFVFVIALVSAPAMAQDDLLFPIGEGDFQWGDLDAFSELDFSGQELVVSSPWGNVGDQANVENVFAYFEYATGIEVVHIGSDSFEQQIVIDLEAGSPPDIAVFPQPGLAGDQAKNGFLVPLGDDVRENLLENYAAGESWVSMSTYMNEEGEEVFYAIPYKLDLKSLVWYVPENFEDAGYEVPTSMEELIALSDQIVADGEKPWCIAVGSDAATGWPATDWVEDMMLRTQTPEVYDQWVTNEIPFTDERVISAIETFGKFVLNDDYVFGGTEAVITTYFGDSVLGLFEVPADCYMYRMASFIPVFFPEGTEIGVDADFFYFPAYESRLEELGRPVLTAGTFWTITQDSEASRALMNFILTPLANELWMAQSSFLSVHSGANIELYSSDAARAQGEILLSADVVRFDGGDLMPGAVGAGSFWTEMVNYINGKPVEDVAADIQASWDAIK